MNNLNIKTGEENKKIISDFEIGLIAFLLIYYLLPSASNSVPFVLSVAIGFVYIFYILTTSVLTKDVADKMFKMLIAIVFVTFCYYFLTVTHTVGTQVSNYDLKRFASKFQQLFFTFLPIIVSYRIFSFAKKGQINFLIIVSLIIVVYVMIRSLGELSVNDTASRVWSDFNEMAEKNVGTYNFVYAVSISLPGMFALFFHTESRLKKTAIIIYLIIGFVFLVVAKYTLSLLISVAFCYVAILICAKSRTTKVLTLVITPLLLVLLPMIIEFFALNVASGSMSIRLLEVASFFSGEKMGYNLGGRIKLYKDTLEAFVNSPLIGNSSMQFDGHATFLTVLSDIGLVGAIPFYWLYFSSRTKINEFLPEKKMKNCFLVTFLSVIATGFVNPIHAALPLPMMAFFIVPMVVFAFMKKD